MELSPTRDSRLRTKLIFFPGQGSAVRRRRLRGGPGRGQPPRVQGDEGGPQPAGQAQGGERGVGGRKEGPEVPGEAKEITFYDWEYFAISRFKKHK